MTNSSFRHSRKVFTIACCLALVATASAARTVSRDLIPTNGLVGWWKGNGNAKDSAGDHDGVLKGGMGFGSGVEGQAFAAGSGKRVYIPDSPDFQLTSFTIGAWINISADGYYVFFRGDDRTSLDPFVMATDFSERINVGITAETGETDGISAPITYHEWHQVTGTFDAKTHELRLYIDGKLEARKATTLQPLQALDNSQVPGLGIGNVQDGYDFPFQGRIDDVVLYSRALSPAEVHKLTHNLSSVRHRRGRSWWASIFLYRNPRRPDTLGLGG
jgi:hypothetical protein